MEDEKIVDLFFARSDLAISELDTKYGKTCHQLSYKILNNLLDAEECVNERCLPWHLERHSSAKASFSTGFCLCVGPQILHHAVPCEYCCETKQLL